MDMKNLPVGTKVRTTELIGCGTLLGQIAFIPRGAEVVITQVYGPHSDDASYRVEGLTNLDHTGQGIAFHDEIEVL